MEFLHDEIKPNHPSRSLRVSNCITFVVYVTVQVICQTTIFGSSDLEITARFPTPLTPATWAFAIWAGIFVLQGIGVVYQALPHGYKSDGMKQRYVNGIGYGWQFCWIAEIAWQILFLLQTALGMSLCLVSLAAALAIMARTLYNMYRLKQEHGSLSSILMYVAFFLPSSIHTAWLSTSAAVAALMVPQALNHTSHLEGIAAVLAIIVTIVGVAIVQKHRDSAYGLTLVWTLVAVYGEQRSPFIRVVILVNISVAILASIFAMLRRKNPGSQEPSEIRQPLSRINNI